MLQHFLGGGHLHNAAAVHKNNGVGQLQGLAHIVGDEHNGLVQLLLQALYFVLQVLAGHGVQGAEGFVHQHHRGRGGQGPEDADALLLAAGQL